MNKPTETQVWTFEDEIEAAIKPCPRCGGKGILEGTMNDEIVCVDCGFWSGEDYDDLDAAIEWWNNQPLVDSLHAQIAQLTAENARLMSEAGEWVPLEVYSEIYVVGEGKVEYAIGVDGDENMYVESMYPERLLFSLPPDKHRLYRRTSKEGADV